MSEILILSPSKYKALGYAHGNVEDTTVIVAIRRAQQIQLCEVLGVDEYKRITLVLEATKPPTLTPLTPADAILVEDYVIPYLVAVTDLRILKPLTYRLKNAGTGTVSDENFKAANKQEFAVLSDQMRTDVTAYEDRLRSQLTTRCEVVEPSRLNSIRFC
jgi:hypothetical protein